MAPPLGFDSLPDPVACCILSRLDDAQKLAQCATVCRRWRQLAEWVDALTVVPFEFCDKRMEGRRAQDVQAIVNHVLFRTSSVRRLSISYHPVVWPWLPQDHFQEEAVVSWLCHVASSVEILTLVDPNRTTPQKDRWLQLSHCRRLSHLSLCYGLVPVIPPLCQPFESLRTVSLALVTLTDSSLQDLLALCPLLNTLLLNSCHGLLSPLLTSASLTDLTLANDFTDISHTPISSIVLDTPKLENLLIVQQVASLVAQNVSSLVHLELRCHVQTTVREAFPSLKVLHLAGRDWTVDSFTELVRQCPSLRVLAVDIALSLVMPVRLDWLLRRCLDVEELTIGVDLFQCLHAGSKNLLRCCQQLRLLRLRSAHIAYDSGDKMCVEIFTGLLKCAPALKALEADARGLERVNLSFFSDILQLQRDYPQVKFSLPSPSRLM
eukprot:TRINITY_DN15273_c0_g2_i1.p1 TRINITY_DN15273_c0_g2~~TRINITY_DN15273_c0_g2_i1.p1  ORF type:complete len:436 (+),score=65.80 TRINITY_DN15273_c0_g2_i1:927-2234(+)